MTEPMGGYAAGEYSSPAGECDLVMKGGVTSGLVYPYAILELGRAYRFRSIGGASAGAIAAAFAAAAEYARTVRGDEAGFIRLKACCDALPQTLGKLFQPAPPFAPVMRALLGAQQATTRAGAAWALARAFGGEIALGAVLGAALMIVLDAGMAGALLGAAVGVALAVAWRLREVVRRLPEHGFGMCPGTTQPGGDGPGLTDWLHSSIQEIAFGDRDHPRPLTFGDLAGADPDAPLINLRMVTTNLSMRRPHTLPRLRMTTGFLEEQWAKLFPKPVMTYLLSVAEPLRRFPSHRAFPAPDLLPVVVGVRMSLSFPLLFSAIPMVTRDIESALIARGTGAPGRVRWRPIWFSDGGLSSNFPIHMFDALLPSRPTFALSLDDLPEGAREDGRRVFIPAGAAERTGLAVHPIKGVAGFVMSLLGAAKEWQDGLLSGLPGQRERIARVFLSKGQGALNLTMPPDQASELMRYGQSVGRQFAEGAFDFDEHRWRRALVAYEQLELTINGNSAVWTEAGFGDFLKTYAQTPPPVGAKSYKKVGKADRLDIQARLDAFAQLAQVFSPGIRNRDRKFPRPAGRLRIGPDY